MAWSDTAPFSSGFVNPFLWQAILAQVSQPQREMEAEKRFMFLQTRLPVRSRGVARLLLNLVEHARMHERHEGYLAELAWWIEVEEAEGLTASLNEQLEAGEIDAELIWRVLEAAENYWPPYRRMAVLEAYKQHPDGTPLHRIGNFHYTRGRIRSDLGQYPEALEDRQRADICPLCR